MPEIELDQSEMGDVNQDKLLSEDPLIEFLLPILNLNDVQNEVELKNSDIFFKRVGRLIGDAKVASIQEAYQIPGNPPLIYDARVLLMAIASNLQPDDLQNLQNNLPKHYDPIDFLKDIGLMAQNLIKEKGIMDPRVAMRGDDEKQFNKKVALDASRSSKIAVRGKYEESTTENTEFSLLEKMDDEEKNKYISDLFLAKNIAYKTWQENSLIPLRDSDGVERMYQVKNIAHERGLHVMALVPFNHDNDGPLDIKVLFRGTQDAASAKMDLEQHGAGSTTMDANRLDLLRSVNHIIENVKSSHPNRSVCLTITGHSLGGALSQRFFSEVNQAYLHQRNCVGENSLRPVDIHNKLGYRVKSSRKMASTLVAQIRDNQEAFADQDFSAIASIQSMQLTTANSTMLSKHNAHIGDAAIAFNCQHSGLVQTLQAFKVGGDIVAQTGYDHLGRSLATGYVRNLEINILQKKGRYEKDSSVRLEKYRKTVRSPKEAIKDTAKAHTEKTPLNDSVGDARFVFTQIKPPNQMELDIPLRSAIDSPKIEIDNQTDRNTLRSIDKTLNAGGLGKAQRYVYHKSLFKSYTRNLQEPKREIISQKSDEKESSEKDISKRRLL